MLFANSSLPRLLYSLTVVFLLPWAVLHLLWRAWRQPEYLQHWAERFGFFCRRNAAPTLWLHAVSVGETRAAQPLVAALKAHYPGHRILFTHMTPTGRATSEALYGDSVERCYLPYDTPWAMRRFLRHYQPCLGLIMETELWPNMIAACRARKIPLLLVNARLSARSAKRYAFFSAVAAQTLRRLTAIGAQSEQDAERLKSLGAVDPVVTGNLKFDIAPPDAQLALAQHLRSSFGKRPVWLAASTREGEEALILDAWKAKGNDDALLIIVPRHPQRFVEVARLTAERGFTLQRRSEDAPITLSTRVLIGDSMGEMFAWYASADVAYIGGSLLDFGGQNLIEACAVGTPVLLGRYTRNFAEASRAAVACGAALAVEDAEQLVAAACGLLADTAARTCMAEAGRAFAEAHRGATARTMQLIEARLPA
jgi:3-deoxy-D-manno-octulosonic-acid transferase